MFKFWLAIAISAACTSCLSSGNSMPDDDSPICYGIPTKQGFHANIYEYPKDGNAVDDDSFYRGGYKEMGAMIGSSDGVVNPYIGLLPKDVYGVKIPDSTNFSVELTGYFLATKSGTHKFTMTGNDDALGLQIGRATNSSCTGDFDSMLPETVTKNLYPNKVTGHLEVDLIAGQFYPMRLVYANTHLFALLSINVIPPGSILGKNLDSVFQVDTVDFSQNGPTYASTPSVSGTQEAGPTSSGSYPDISKIPNCFGVPTKSGFDANIYEYPKDNKAVDDDSFYRGGFKEMGSLLGSVDGVVNPYIGLLPKDVYGVKIPDSTNFSVELTGYFLAAKSGTHKFTMTGNDDALGLQFGRALNSSCTDDFDSMLSENVTKNLYPNKVTGHMEVDLIAGQFYPMRLVYANTHLFALLSINVTPPGSILGQNLDNIFQLDTARYTFNSDKTTSSEGNSGSRTTTGHPGSKSNTFSTATRYLNRTEPSADSGISAGSAQVTALASDN